MSEIVPDPNILSLPFVDTLFQDFLRDPHSVSPEWRRYFQEHAGGDGFTSQASFPAAPVKGNGEARRVKRVKRRDDSVAIRQHRVDFLIRNFRVRGHRIAQLDPLGLQQAQDLPELNPAFFGLTEEDLDAPFATESYPGPDTQTLREIIERYRTTYCRSIGVQFMHIDDLEMRDWLQERMENSMNRIELTREEQLRILTRLTDAIIFEDFIQKKFTGAKRFSLEGGESLIPLLDLAIERAGEHGVKEIVIGMAHRGRLNVLANILNKSPREIFREFSDVDAAAQLGRGDVKYHMGYHNDWITTQGREIHVALCFNPSHLEFVNPVVLGRVRAKQDRLGDLERRQHMALLIHGDAAFAGEGIVQETLNLSELKGYRTGGTLHVIVNNQLGFTTDPEDGRSTLYASDVAKMLQIPIFHVNGEDPEAVAQVVKLGMEFRHAFQRDVVIDMYCYRRRGHNEGDEPAFTQPLLYAAIQQRMSVRDGYLDHLFALGGLTREEADEIAEKRRQTLEEELAIAHEPVQRRTPSIMGRIWRRYRGGKDADTPEVDTGVERQRLVSLLERLARVPKDMAIHPKLERLLESRREMARGEKPLDWAAAEALAMATLSVQGVRVRLSGQDSERGTFSHRHAFLRDQKTGRKYAPLQHLGMDQAPVEIYNSPLSEAGVLGFEYGYSIAFPDGLVMWEAQFGDFCNAAQVIVDQFIASAEDKWNSLSGLVLLLPHGFEGMGPEHSSARLERFLLLSAEDNLQVINPTTPAQFFHALRRQVLRTWRKPLIVMTPKSLLRHPQCVSSIDDLTQGRFQRILGDTAAPHPGVKRVLLCSGKLYYDLAAARETNGRKDVAILRVEQLHPLAEETLEAALAPYPDKIEVYWVQEEPENMGAWRYMRIRFGEKLLGRYPFHGVSRPASASPATGSAKGHAIEQAHLIEQAFA